VLRVILEHRDQQDQEHKDLKVIREHKDLKEIQEHREHQDLEHRDQ
jgi:hypothetical protein